MSEMRSKFFRPKPSMFLTLLFSETALNSEEKPLHHLLLVLIYVRLQPEKDGRNVVSEEVMGRKIPRQQHRTIVNQLRECVERGFTSIESCET